ncbi:hypothetical protein EJ04DRAFT_586916 [Polyplosphaeria fusca]|uniref:BRCT domain-containing protein n=1 Tax=Polyplosphaeria fusca TaxID=682080 RepID=A0A9P4R398_9PLEO|nr:hypothetical protein EJ04DRAFT_586916 [Polyplosphaeria fusca]
MLGVLRKFARLVITALGKRIGCPANAVSAMLVFGDPLAFGEPRRGHLSLPAASSSVFPSLHPHHQLSSPQEPPSQLHNCTTQFLRPARSTKHPSTAARRSFCIPQESPSNPAQLHSCTTQLLRPARTTKQPSTAAQHSLCIPQEPPSHAHSCTTQLPHLAMVATRSSARTKPSEVSEPAARKSKVQKKTPAPKKQATKVEKKDPAPKKPAAKKPAPKKSTPKKQAPKKPAAAKKTAPAAANPPESIPKVSSRTTRASARQAALQPTPLPAVLEPSPEPELVRQITPEPVRQATPPPVVSEPSHARETPPPAFSQPSPQPEYARETPPPAFLQPSPEPKYARPTPPPVGPQPSPEPEHAPSPVPAPAPKVLEGTVILVEVTSAGVSQQKLFAGMLQDMGASIAENPTRADITHVVYKDGRLSTIDQVMENNSGVKCVGVGWAIDCEKQQTRVNEDGYLISPVKPLRPSPHKFTPAKTPSRVFAMLNSTRLNTQSPKLTGKGVALSPIASLPSTPGLSEFDPEISMATLPSTPGLSQFDPNSSMASLPTTPGLSQFLEATPRPPAAQGSQLLNTIPGLSPMASLPATPALSEFPPSPQGEWSPLPSLPSTQGSARNKRKRDVDTSSPAKRARV